MTKYIVTLRGIVHVTANVELEAASQEKAQKRAVMWAEAGDITWSESDVEDIQVECVEEKR